MKIHLKNVGMAALIMIIGYSTWVYTPASEAGGVVYMRDWPALMRARTVIGQTIARSAWGPDCPLWQDPGANKGSEYVISGTVQVYYPLAITGLRQRGITTEMPFYVILDSNTNVVVGPMGFVYAVLPGLRIGSRIELTVVDTELCRLATAVSVDGSDPVQLVTYDEDGQITGYTTDVWGAALLRPMVTQR